MQPIAISTLTICGIEELPAQSQRKVSHVLSLLDPDLPELESFLAYEAHERTTLRFHDIITPQEGRVHPTQAHVGNDPSSDSLRVSPLRGDRSCFVRKGNRPAGIWIRWAAASAASDCPSDEPRHDEAQTYRSIRIRRGVDRGEHR